MGIKVSIIVPVYNTGEYLRKCFYSLMGQTLKELEFIIVDDGSTDSSGSICDEYAQRDSRFKVIHKNNEGVSAARNKGITAAQGEYIGFVDSDDTVKDNMYERMYCEALENEADVVMCDAVTIYPDNHEEADTITRLSDTCTIKKSCIPPVLLKELAGSSWRCIYSKAVIQRHSELFPVALKFSEDRVFNIYMFGYANKIRYIKEAYYNRLIVEDSAVHRFHSDYFETAKYAAQCVEKAIKEAWDNDLDYQTEYLEHFVIAAMGAINNYFYKTSPMSLKERYIAVKRICNDKQLQEALDRKMCGGIRGRMIKKKAVLLLSLLAVILNKRYGR